MERLKTVLTKAQFKTTISSAMINSDPGKRAVFTGCRKDADNSAFGLIGKIAEHSAGRNLLDYGVWLDFSFPHVIGVFGARGSGKSFDLGIIAEALANLNTITVGNVPSMATVVFDVQNQFWTLGLKPSKNLPEDKEHLKIIEKWGLSPQQVSNLNLWLPSGCNTNLPEVNYFKLSPAQLLDSDWLSLLELERYTPMGQALLALLSERNDGDVEYLAARALPSNRVLSSFQQSTIDGLRWRLQALAHTDLVGEPGIDATNLLKPSTTSILLLRDLPESLRSLVIGALMRIFSSRMGNYHQSRRVARRHEGVEMPSEDFPERVWVILDEAHVVVPSYTRTAATEPIVDYVKRGRDSGLSLVFATQQPSAIDHRLMSQVDLTLTHSLGFDSDLQAAIGRMPTRTSVDYEKAGFKIPSLGDAIRLLDTGVSFVADSANGRVFISQMRCRLTAHGGNTP